MICNKDYRYFDIAKQVASFSDFPRVKIGAACIYKNKIISVGWNQTKSNPIQAYYNKFREFDLSGGHCPTHGVHAEMHAIIQIKGMNNIDFSKIKMYIYRQTKSGSMAMSRPCIGCIQAIKDVGIKNICYTTNCDYVYERLK